MSQLLDKRSKWFRSLGVSPPNQAKARVLRTQMIANCGLRVVRVRDHHSGRSTRDGMAIIAGCNRPFKNSREREIVSVPYVKCMVIAKWSETLTNEPRVVPSATPIAPKRLAR